MLEPSPHGGRVKTCIGVFTQSGDDVVKENMRCGIANVAGQADGGRQKHRAAGRALSSFRLGLMAASGLALGACASLPVSGPTGRQVLRQSVETSDGLHFRVVELGTLASLPKPPAPTPVERLDNQPPPTDLIGPGDVLHIEIYESGVTLFAGSNTRAAASDMGGLSSAAQTERMGQVRVDDAGFIRLPYAGKLRAAGHTSAELASIIGSKMLGMSQNPQVVVGIEQSITNSVILGGEVARPGRLVLATNRESLSDIIALAGGYRGEAKDLAVRVVRGGKKLEYRLADVMSGPERDMAVSPGDRVEVVRAPMSFAVMGAAGRIEHMGFAAPAMSLAEALAAAGGANQTLGDAKAIFVFRFERGEGQRGEGGGEQPVVYHLNMMRAGAYFLSQRFPMRDKDLLYVGNAAANQPTKLIQLISQLFAPVVAVEGALINTGVVR